MMKKKIVRQLGANEMSSCAWYIVFGHVAVLVNSSDECSIQKLVVGSQQQEQHFRWFFFLFYFEYTSSAGLKRQVKFARQIHASSDTSRCDRGIDSNVRRRRENRELVEGRWECFLPKEFIIEPVVARLLSRIYANIYYSERWWWWFIPRQGSQSRKKWRYSYILWMALVIFRAVVVWNQFRLCRFPPVTFNFISNDTTHTHTNSGKHVESQ